MHDMFEAHPSMYLTDERAKLIFFVRHAEGNPLFIEGRDESPALVASRLAPHTHTHTTHTHARTHTHTHTHTHTLRARPWGLI